MKRSPARADDAKETVKSRPVPKGSSPGTRIDTIRQGASGTTIIVAGGSSFLFRPSQAEELGLDSASLLPGADLGEDAAGLLSLAAEAYEAEQKGVALLSRAEQSSQMLRQKLEARGISQKAARIAIERLSADGTLSDRRYAEAVTRQKAGTHGRQAIAAVLRAKGVDADVAAEAVAGLTADDDATLVAVWRRRFGQPPADDRERARQVRFLQSRGFALSAILRFLRELRPDRPAPEV